MAHWLLWPVHSQLVQRNVLVGCGMLGGTTCRLRFPDEKGAGFFFNFFQENVPRKKTRRVPGLFSFFRQFGGDFVGFVIFFFSTVLIATETCYPCLTA
jgi:hypothetical protein